MFLMNSEERINIIVLVKQNEITAHSKDQEQKGDDRSANSDHLIKGDKDHL